MSDFDSLSRSIDRVVAERNRLQLQLDKAKLGLKLIAAKAGSTTVTTTELGIYAEVTLDEIEATP